MQRGVLESWMMAGANGHENLDNGWAAGRKSICQLILSYSDRRCLNSKLRAVEANRALR